jgi:hypothetical protein
MKKITLFSLICIIISTLFSSCGSLSMTKRHYTKGYYIDYTTGVQAKATPQVTQKQNQPVATTSSKQTKLIQNTEVTYSNPGIKTKKPLVIVKNKKMQLKVASQQTTKQSIPDKSIALEGVAIQTQQAVPISQNISNDSDGRGHSLLWLVVVIILILWLIGLLAGGLGLGGLLNVLLVVALILLILWLLRIV